MSDIILKPCPFCGNEAVLQWRRSSKTYHGYYAYLALATCDTCKASSQAINVPRKYWNEDDEPNFDSQPFRQAALLWNNRVPLQ